VRRRSPLVAIALVATACGGGQGAKAPTSSSNEEARAALARKPGTSTPVRGFLVAAVGERTVGPLSARHPDGRGGLVAWVTAAEGQGRRVVGVSLAGNGEPRGPEKLIAAAPLETNMLVVKTMRGAAPGFVVAWTSLTDRGEALHAVVTGEDGTPRGKPIELARTTDDIVWVDVVATDLGAVCLWAEDTRGNDANIVAASLDTDGKVRGVPARVARGVTGWQATEVPGGVGVSTVVTAANARGGVLSYQKLDAQAHTQGEPVVIAPKPTVSGDMEVVRDAHRVVFAWTDRTGDEPQIAAASLGDDGKVEAPRKVVEGRGGAGLLRLSAGDHGAGMLWESPVHHGKADSIKVHIARIGADLAPDGRAASLECAGEERPELAAIGAGFAVASRTRDCTLDASCPSVASVVRLDGDLSVVQRESLGFSGDPASIAWDLSCGTNACYALAASGPSPSRVRSVTVNARDNALVKAEAPAPAPDPLRVSDVAAIVSGESVADLAAAKVGDATILAMLSSKPDAKAGQVLTTRVLEAASAPVVLSTRALAVGGVAIAPAEKPEDGAAVAWVARENGDPEVHVTHIDKKGKRTNDVQLTTTKGDASDVAIAWAGGGWIVAWVDGRDGNGEVYATKVGPDLNRIAREERITNAPGDASGLVALARGDLVWLAWGDSRESPKDGTADVFLTAVKMRDAKKVEPERRLLATAPNSRSPQLALTDDGMQIAWIEESPMGFESPNAAGRGAMWATLDAQGKTVLGPVKLPLAGEGAPTAVALEPASPPRAVIARSGADSIALDGVILGQSPRAVPLLTLDGPPSMDVTLLLHGGVLFFNDDGPAVSDKRARRARIDWSR
jgi:hypothetical protein